MLYIKNIFGEENLVKDNNKLRILLPIGGISIDEKIIVISRSKYECHLPGHPAWHS